MAEKRKDSKGRNLPDGMQERPNGTYMSRFTVKGRRFTLYAKDIESLKAKVEETKTALRNGTYIEPNNKTLNQLYDDYRETYLVKSVRETTLSNYDSLWRQYIKNDVDGKPKGIGCKKVKDLRQSDIIRGLNKFVEVRNLSDSTIKLIYNLLNGCLEFAETDRIIEYNPCKGVLRKIKKGKTKQCREALEPEEETLFLDFIESSEIYNVYFPMFTFMFYSGVRFGEMAGLTWADIDFKNNEFTIHRTCEYKNLGEGMQFVMNKPKSAAGLRTIPMVQTLKTQLLQQRQLNMIRGIHSQTVCGVSDFVFMTSKGKPFVNWGVNRLIHNAVKEYNKLETETAKTEKRQAFLLRDFSCHNIRHTVATDLCVSTNDVKSVQQILGHSSSSMTLDIYAHARQERTRATMEKLERRTG
ncbi:MAG: site-specific integrase [Clostridiales bacterium]|nr:site-specific integrase [Clostridiales bacterium]